MLRSALVALPVTVGSLPVLISSAFAESVPSDEQVYLHLYYENFGFSGAAFPQRDRESCEIEGKRFLQTPIERLNRNKKSYYCVRGVR